MGPFHSSPLHCSSIFLAFFSHSLSCFYFPDPLVFYTLTLNLSFLGSVHAKETLPTSCIEGEKKVRIMHYARGQGNFFTLFFSLKRKQKFCASVSWLLIILFLWRKWKSIISCEVCIVMLCQSSILENKKKKQNDFFFESLSAAKISHVLHDEIEYLSALKFSTFFCFVFF